MTTAWSWNGDADHVLALLPQPHFRQRDIDAVADRMGIQRWRLQGAWAQLRLTGRIVRTPIAIGKAKGRFYWERSHCSINVTAQNRRALGLLTSPGGWRQ